MAKTKFKIDLDIKTKPIITLVDHAKMQKMKTGGGSHDVVFGKHVPKFKLMNGRIEWDFDKKTKKPIGLKMVEMSVKFWGEISISKAIDKNSKCYKLVEAHECDHQKICIKELKAARKACEAIIRKQTEAAIKKFKGDHAAFAEKEATAGRNLFISAYKEIDDGPFYKVAVKSLAIDTPAVYGKISPHCAAYG